MRWRARDSNHDCLLCQWVYSQLHNLVRTHSSFVTHAHNYFRFHSNTVPSLASALTYLYPVRAPPLRRVDETPDSHVERPLMIITRILRSVAHGFSDANIVKDLSAKVALMRATGMQQ
jgi:hypothetical protein